MRTELSDRATRVQAIRLGALVRQHLDQTERRVRRFVGATVQEAIRLAKQE